MSETWEEMLLTVRAGVGQPPQMRMPMDEVLGPLSIGSSGSWCIVAPGVLGEHGYLYFDGTDLFLQSADPQNPLLVDGQPVPDVWTPVYWPCEISLGVARLQYTNPGQTVRLSTALLGQTLPLGFIPAPVPKRQPASSASPAPTPPLTFEAPPAQEPSPSFRLSPVFGPPPSPEPAAAPEPTAAPEPAMALQLPPKRSRSSKPARPFAPGAFSDRTPDPEATRVHPIEITAASRGARLKLPDSDDANLPGGERRGSAPPAPAADRFGTPPMIEALPVASPQPPPGTPIHLDIPPDLVLQRAAAPAPSAATTMGWLKARWEEASGPKKALIVLLPPLIGSVWIIFTEPPPRNTRPAPPAASATAATSAQVTASATAAPSQVTTMPMVEPSSSPAAPLASEKPPASATARPAETSRAVAPPPAPPTPSSGGKTAQREAADAVAAGAFEQAAKLYEELAKVHPDVPAYAEAARILRTKVKR